jgi:arylsulfatase A-like enzyme
MRSARTHSEVLTKLLAAALLLSSASAALSCRRREVSASSSRPPNVVLILADDLGIECLSSYGGSSYATPNLDRLAAEGVRFEHCYSQPLCSPSRVQLLTGQYFFRNYLDWSTIDEGATTFAERLRDAGYATAIAGKWEFGDFGADPDLPARFGFDAYRCAVRRVEEGGARPTGRGRGEATPRYWSPVVIENGALLEGTEGRYGPDLYCDFLLEFMRQNASRPFLAFHSMVLTHAPLRPTPDSVADERGKRVRRSKRFGDMVAYLDKLVGRILGELEALDLLEDTLILFCADNGSPRGVASQWNGMLVPGGKHSGMESDFATHVPLIASWKGVTPAGAVSDALVDLSDFLPTLCDLARIPLEEGEIDGKSFAPELRGTGGSGREWVYWPQQRGCARDRRFKLLSDGRLYDMAADPMQTRQIPPGADAEADRARALLESVLSSSPKRASPRVPAR